MPPDPRGDPPFDPSLLRAIARLLLEQEQAEERMQRLRSLDRASADHGASRPASLLRGRRSGEQKP